MRVGKVGQMIRNEKRGSRNEGRENRKKDGVGGVRKNMNGEEGEM